MFEAMNFISWFILNFDHTYKPNMLYMVLGTSELYLMWSSKSLSSKRQGILVYEVCLKVTTSVGEQFTYNN